MDNESLIQLKTVLALVDALEISVTNSMDIKNTAEQALLKLR